MEEVRIGAGNELDERQARMAGSTAAAIPIRTNSRT
jgi:hypothetical protein